MNQHYHKEVLTKSENQGKLCKNCFIFHPVNATSHTTLPMKKFLAKNTLLTIQHPSDLVPCDFFPFPKFKTAFKGARFESTEKRKRQMS